MNEKDAVVDFLNGESKAKDIFAEEPVKDKAEEPVVEEREEKPLPFHKDPKVQRYVERQIANALKEVKPSAEQQFRKEVSEIKLPSSFVKLIGNDTEEKRTVLKDLSNYFGTLKGEARQEFLEEMQKQQQEAVEADKAAMDELDAGFEAIEEEYGVDLDSDTKTRADFVEFLRKVSPKNAEGEVREFADILSTWETFQERQEQKPAKPSRAKELASRGLARSTDAAHIPTRPKTWDEVDKFISKLKT